MFQLEWQYRFLMEIESFQQEDVGKYSLRIANDYRESVCTFSIKGIGKLILSVFVYYHTAVDNIKIYNVRERFGDMPPPLLRACSDNRRRASLDSSVGSMVILLTGWYWVRIQFGLALHLHVTSSSCV